MSCQKQKGRENEMKMTFLKEEKAYQYWIAVRRPIDFDKRITEYQELLVLGVFFEPVLDF